jgi:enterochelin esterase-like enzyme
MSESAWRKFLPCPIFKCPHMSGSPAGYGRSLVEEVKPYIDSHFRTRPAAQTTGAMGSSLEGVVAFYIG